MGLRDPLRRGKGGLQRPRTSDLLRHRGNVADAGRQAQQIQRWAAFQDAQQLLARSHFVLPAVFQEIGDLPVALEHAVRAVERRRAPRRAAGPRRSVRGRPGRR